MTPRLRGPSLPGWLFAAFVAAAGPLILFHYGAYHWFLRDDWVLLADRGDTPFAKLFEPVGGSHWIAVPRLVYGALWPVFGLTTYRPYQLCSVILHLAVVVQLRVVMRRAGVRPWLASAAAAVLVLFGPGAQDIIWAFQIGFTGSIAFGLAQLLLTDHDGPSDRRDALGLGFGLLAIMSSGVGLTTTVAVAVAVLLRRGWRPAALCSVPLLAAYGVWALAAGADATGGFGRPTPGVLLSWVWSSALGTIVGLAHFEVLAWFLAGLVVVGLALLGRGGDDRRAEWRRLGLPLALAAAAVFFAGTTGLSRWWLGAAAARASRYVYLEAALVLPLVAVAAEAVARRWTRSTAVLVVALLLPIPFNLDGFGGGLLGKAYMDRQREVLTTAVRMPFARDVPRDVRPLPDPYASDAVTIGFLLTAASNGDLTPSTIPLTDEVVNEFKVRLGVAQRSGGDAPAGCRPGSTPVVLAPEKGDVLHLGSRVSIATVDGDRRTSRPVIFDPSSGRELTVELPDLHLRIGPATGAPTFRLCTQG